MKIAEKCRVVAVCALAVCLVACGGGGSPAQSTPTGPSSSSSSSSSSEPDSSSKTQDEILMDNVQKYSTTPLNATSSWKSKPGYLFEAQIDKNGRVYDGVWRTYGDARPQKNNPHGVVWFTSVMDDSCEGTNCVWDSKTKTMSYKPTNVNDHSTYLEVDGMAYWCNVAKDGTIYNGKWGKLSDNQNDDTKVAFKSFPYIEWYTECDYVWDGQRLHYEPVRTSDPQYWLPGRRTDSSGAEMVMAASVDSNGRISGASFTNVEYLPQNVVILETYPEYISCSRNGCLFWDGKKMTHDGTKSYQKDLNAKYHTTTTVHHWSY